MPQTWRTLVYDGRADRLTPQSLPVGRTVSSMRAMGLGRIVIVVVSRDDAAATAPGVPGLGGRSRRVKDSRKGLASYVPSRAADVHLFAPYRQPGQAERGIRDLAASRAGMHWPGVFLLEVDAKIFDELWARAGGATLAEVGQPARAFGRRNWAGGVVVADIAGESAIDVPESLVNAYVGASPAAVEVRRRVVLASLTWHPILVTGESGTGKEIVARQIHLLGKRPHSSFITVNCAAIAYDLFESELFGHTKGAFTDAIADRPGLYEMAQDGTLFLDEVGDLHPSHQAKVLRMLNDGDYRPVGSKEKEPRKGNARIIAATNRNLPRMMGAGLFREDLYYRLLSFRVETPALRDHPEDIPAIALFLWPRVIASTACTARLSEAALEMLKDYPWQGNVRELRAFLANLSTLAGRRQLTTALVANAFVEWTSLTGRGEDR